MRDTHSKKSGEPLLKISNIDVSHDTFQTLWDISLSVWSDEIVALIGANTAGKSTLLDSISGFLPPSRGSIEFDGEDISSMDPFKVVDLGITQVPEGRKIFPDMTVLDNLILGSYKQSARLKKMENLEKVYTLFPILKERTHQTAKTLSGGQQQMLVIGRGLMSSPRLLLLDEMSLGLAPVVVDELYRILNVIRDQGITILFVEQNIRKSLEESDRAYILESGKVAMSGSSSDLQEDDGIKKAYFGI